MKLILVVDDNISSLKQINTQLEDSYNVMLAKSGAQALSMCAQKRPDLILLDIAMPEMDGFEFIRTLKSYQSFMKIPVVFLTSSRDSAMEIKALESGANDFITKPVEKSILLHRLDLHLRLNDYQIYLEQMVKSLEDSIVTSFSEMVEYRDRNTGGHILRTSKYAELIGLELIERREFTKELHDLDMIIRAAPLHDIGKIGVSDLILLKPGPLDDNEFAAMKLHTTIGASLLRKVYARTPTQTYLKYAILIAESHHERYDGKGYPYGIKGENIPLCSRIMAVADVYDALVDNRVYRPALTHEAAHNIIIAGRGAHFDPIVVDAFNAVQERIRGAYGDRSVELETVNSDFLGVS
jgi:putative two-component system response regulator